MEAVWNLYGPWLTLMLQIGLPLLMLGTPAMFFFERGSTPRRWISQVALWGSRRRGADEFVTELRTWRRDDDTKTWN